MISGKYTFDLEGDSSPPQKYIIEVELTSVHEAVEIDQSWIIGRYHNGDVRTKVKA